MNKYSKMDTKERRYLINLILNIIKTSKQFNPFNLRVKFIQQIWNQFKFKAQKIMYKYIKINNGIDLILMV